MKNNIKETLIDNTVKNSMGINITKKFRIDNLSWNPRLW
jgi:hypothetical protein